MEDTKERWGKTANEETKNDKEVIRSFSEGLNPGQQRGEKGWLEVDNNKHRNCKDKKNKEKEQKTSEEKQKNDTINKNIMEEEEVANTDHKEAYKIEEDRKENNIKMMQRTKRKEQKVTKKRKKQKRSTQTQGMKKKEMILSQYREKQLENR
eukprot:7664251-Ditylum_brightwellii.AAC.1